MLDRVVSGCVMKVGSLVLGMVERGVKVGRFWLEGRSEAWSLSVVRLPALNSMVVPSDLI